VPDASGLLAAWQGTRTAKRVAPQKHLRCSYRWVKPLMPPGARNPGALYFHIYRLADPLCRQALYQYNKAF